jgi:hypothetical protein
MMAGTHLCRFTVAKILDEIFLSSNSRIGNSSESEDIPKGLLRKIIREDLETTLEDFANAYEKSRGH